MPRKRKVISCASCRRLRTRCEKISGLDLCRRCDRLRIRCSLPTFSPEPVGSPTRSEHTAGNISIAENPGPVQEATINVQKRFEAIESTLAEIRGFIVNTSNVATQLDPAPENVVLDAPSPSASSESLDVLHDSTESFAQTAPISVIRDMKHIINGTSPGSAPEEMSADCLSTGLITESLCHSLLDGLQNLPLKRYGLDRDPWEIRHESPLLFASCLLLGLGTIPSLCNSRLHSALCTHTEELASRALLRSPLPLESIQAFLILSTWHLVPQEKDRYIDSWLMSGMGLMHGMLSIDFEKQRGSATDDTRYQRTIRTWNFLCLNHLQFSVGTGRAPVVSKGQLEDYVADDPWNRVAIAQSQLYSVLYDVVTAKQVSTAVLDFNHIQHWRNENKDLIRSDNSQSLLFAYSCARLVHSRHFLKALTGSASSICPNPADLEARTSSLIDIALDHSVKIIRLCLGTIERQGNVTPIFDRMMCTNAAITVIEFKERLMNVQETLALMQKLHDSNRQSRRQDAVFEWALNVMKSAAAEGNTW